jgi:hypothetical protein
VLTAVRRREAIIPARTRHRCFLYFWSCRRDVIYVKFSLFFRLAHSRRLPLPYSRARRRRIGGDRGNEIHMGALSRLPNRASVGLPTAGSTTTIAAQESGTWGTKAKPLAPVLADGFAYLNHCRLCPPAASRRRGEAVLFVAQNLAARRVYKVDLFAQETVQGNIQVFIVRFLFREIPSNTKTGIGTAKQNCSHHILNDENVSRFCQQSILTLTCPAASRSLGLSTGVTRWQRSKSIFDFSTAIH